MTQQLEKSQELNMIGVDTNVLARACLDDDPNEAALAKRLLQQLAHSKQLFISSYAILELVWVLRVKGKNRKQISEAVLTLSDSPGVTIGQRDVIVEAIELYKTGKADFGDYLILAEGKTYSTPQLASFDKTLYKENYHCHHPSKLLKA